ncbi:aromatic acid exporter family protein [Aquibaculum arenosum]|uniref:Aromatic acid exporter family protein n=1 Tax=Aquibaculum arenosum TaxID=3032591 RepID=A0ABT5YNE1_9PROT|nr:aromatic acid exporter family protein [Fodinicurvata sp. CAU 1616]MDF2096469.1 aromatic acid exporter family protein [Fodinicurvata sp. CAU 1616]
MPTLETLLPAGRYKDVLRIALQSVAAALLAYVVMKQLGLGQLSWAIIAALFTIHASLDETLGSSFQRLVAAGLGAGLGVAVVYLFSGFELMPLRIALVAAITNALANLEPELDYASAAGAVVALQPTADLEGAAGTALAVGVGGVAGAIASVTIWPELGRHRAQRSLATALRQCQKLVDLTLKSANRELSREERRERSDVQRCMLETLEEARSIARSTRFRAHLAGGADIREMTRQAEKLWYSLIIIERVIARGRDQFGPEDHEAIMPHFTEAHRALCELLPALAEMVGKNQTTGPDQKLWERFHEAQRSAQDCLKDRPAERNSINEQSVQALLFGLDELRRAVSELENLAACGKADGPDGSD